MAGVVGDFGKLRQLIERMHMLEKPDVVKYRVGMELAAEGIKLVADGFRKEQDPYGDAWAPLKSRSGRILRDTGRMAASVNARPTTTGFRLQISAGYAKYHQYGATYAARSEINKRQLWINTKTRKFAKQRRGGPLAVIERYRHTTKGHTLGRRMMVPDAARGLGPIWTAGFNRTARRIIRNLAKPGKMGGEQ